MKKLLSILLTMLLLSVCIGCSDNPTGSSAEAAGQASKGRGNAGLENPSGITLALLVADQLKDRATLDSARMGVDRLARDFGIEIQTVECEDLNYAEQMKKAAEAYKLVICVGAKFGELESLAPEYPDVKWIWVDGETEKPIKNVLNLPFAKDEGAFLTGYLAAALSRNGVVGVIAPEEDAKTKAVIEAYQQGVAVFDAQIPVLIRYTENEPAKDTACALALAEEKVDVLFPLVSSDGVFELIKEQGIYAIGAKAAQDIAPERLLCSMRLDFGQAIYDAVKALAEGDSSSWGSTRKAALSNGYVGIDYADGTAAQQVPDAVKDKVEELAKQVISGEIQLHTNRAV